MNPKQTLAPYAAFLAIFAIVFTAFAPAASAQKINRSTRGGFEIAPVDGSAGKDAKAEQGQVVCTDAKFEFPDQHPETNPGNYGNTRTFTQPGTTVTASAWQSLKAAPQTFNTAYLGHFGVDNGLGVTDRSEGNGDNGRHRVDNVGDYHNYVVFKFSQPVNPDNIELRSVDGDSDISVWIGNVNGNVVLTQALLNSFGPAEDNNGGSGSRSADINAAGKVGNVLVVASRTTGTDLDDRFKIQRIDMYCPEVPPATITIIKDVQTLDNQDRSTQSFNFTTTGPMSGFSLVDNNDNIANGGPDQTTQTITNFGTAVTVTESQTASWSLLDLFCTTTGGAVANVNFGGRTVSITSVAGSSTTCTFSNGLNIPSAARTTISGRALLANGKGASNAVLSLFDLQTGETRIARTNSFGYFLFDEIEVEKFYVVTISHNRYSFGESTRSFNLSDQISDMNFYQAF